MSSEKGPETKLTALDGMSRQAAKRRHGTARDVKGKEKKRVADREGIKE